MSLPAYTDPGSDFVIRRAPLALMVEDRFTNTLLSFGPTDIELFLSAAAEQFPDLYKKVYAEYLPPCPTDSTSPTKNESKK